MIITIINQNGILPIEHKYKSPVAIYPNRPLALKLKPAQWMQPPTRHIHILWAYCSIQRHKLPLKLCCMSRLNFCFRARFKK